MASKQLLRKKYIRLRKRKYFPVSKNFFFPVIQKFKIILKKKRSKIALYYPAISEVNVLKIMELKLLKKFKILLPVIKGQQIKFCEWSKIDVMKVNKFGILEPALYSKYMCPDIILVPLLAYDEKKNRLGYGKGYYDRFLNNLLKKNGNITTVGVAFSFQKHQKIPTSFRDIKLNNILTEKGII